MKKRRFAREDWLDLAHRDLAAHGPDALKLDRICASAGLTKGSFYHHFPDLPAFQTAVAKHWVTVSTEKIIETIDGTSDARKRGEQLNDLALMVDFRLELGIRELARRNAAVKDIVRECDARRVGVVGDIYCNRYGINAEDARFAAYIEYAAFIGCILIDPDMEPSAQKALSDRFQTVMTRYFEEG